MENVVWIVCKDEEFYIDMALKSIADKVDGIYVLDTGSTDRTMEIIRSFNRDIVLDQTNFVGDFGFGDDGETTLRNYAIKRVKETLNPKKYLIQLDADEIFNDRFFEILKDFGGSCLAHSTNILTTPYTVSTHPLDIEVWEGVRLFDPHVRTWKADLPICWDKREGKHGIPRLKGYPDFLDVPDRVIVPDHVHFHLHNSFGPKCKGIPERRFEEPLKYPIPEYVIEKWKEWKYEN